MPYNTNYSSSYYRCSSSRESRTTAIYSSGSVPATVYRATALPSQRPLTLYRRRSIVDGTPYVFSPRGDSNNDGYNNRTDITNNTTTLPSSPTTTSDATNQLLQTQLNESRTENAHLRDSLSALSRRVGRLAAEFRLSISDAYRVDTRRAGLENAASRLHERNERLIEQLDGIVAQIDGVSLLVGI